jgi:hypothetical protein
VSTTDEIESKAVRPGVGDEVQYEFMSARALRGTEARTIAKWEKDGWELDTQSPGTLRTELTFRRVKPKNAWQQCVAFVAAHWPAFGRLTSTTQQFALAAASGLVVLVLVGAVVAAGVLGGGTAQPAASPTGAAVVTSEQAAAAPTSAETGPDPEAYTYTGPQYEIVVVDENVSAAELTRFWVLTNPFDYSTDEYKNQIRMIVEDLARQNGTADLMVDVVTDREIAEAEAFSTYEQFVAEHGEDYAINTIPKKEEEHWVASYTGGFDPDTLQPSNSADAYEIIWWNPYAPETFEQWKPALAG